MLDVVAVALLITWMIYVMLAPKISIAVTMVWLAVIVSIIVELHVFITLIVFFALLTLALFLLTE